MLFDLKECWNTLLDLYIPNWATFASFGKRSCSSFKVGIYMFVPIVKDIATQNLLVIVFVLLSATGCSMVPQSGGSCCPDQCATAKPCPLKHRDPKKSKCRCKHCAHHAPLFPGDAYGQYNAGYMPGQPMLMPSSFGSCGSECSDCGGQNFDAGFSSGGMEMDGMPVLGEAFARVKLA